MDHTTVVCVSADAVDFCMSDNFIVFVHEPSMKSVPSEGTSQSLLFIEGIHVDV